MSGKPKNFTPEFKEQAVGMVVDSSPPRPIAQVARELGINETTLGFWVKAYREKHAADPLPPGMPDSKLVKELEHRVRDLEMENAFLKKSRGVLREEATEATVTEKYEFIDAEYAIPPVEDYAPTILQMCGWMEVSKSGYYDWRSRPESATVKRRELLKVKIKALFEANNEEYGYRRMHQALIRGGEQVRQLMRELGLESCQPKPWRRSVGRTGICAEQDFVGQGCACAALLHRRAAAMAAGSSGLSALRAAIGGHPHPLPFLGRLGRGVRRSCRPTITSRPGDWKPL